MRLITFFVCLLLTPFVLAQSVLDPSDSAFIDQVANALKSFGGAPAMVKITIILMLVVGSMKSTLLRKLVWDRLGKAKVWVAPILGIIAGVLEPLLTGQHVTLQSVLIFMTTGFGAVLLFNLLESIKGIPKLGPLYVSLINFIESLLGGKTKEEKIVDAQKKVEVLKQ